MTMVKEYLGPIVIILLAGLLVSFAVVPLQNTEWAEGIRAEASGHSEGFEAEGPEGRGMPGGVLMVVLPLIKVTVLMGIGGLLTALISWIIGKFKR